MSLNQVLDQSEIDALLGGGEEEEEEEEGPCHFICKHQGYCRSRQMHLLVDFFEFRSDRSGSTRSYGSLGVGRRVDSL